MRRTRASFGFSEDRLPRPGRLRISPAGFASAISARPRKSNSAGTPRSLRVSRSPSAAGPRRFALRTNDGVVALDVVQHDAGRFQATLTSVEPSVRSSGSICSTGCSSSSGGDAMRSIGRYHRRSPSPACNPIIAVADVETLARIDYDFELMRALMLEHDLATTLQLIWREHTDLPGP